jgi:hypothetical protein
MLKVESMPDRVNTTESLVRRGRYVTASMLLDLGDCRYIIHVREGVITAVEPEPAVMPVWTFALRAPREEWEKFFTPHPLPGSNDIMALMRRRVMTAEGDLHPFIANLQYFKDILATLRGRESDQ